MFQDILLKISCFFLNPCFVSDYLICVIISIICSTWIKKELPVCDFSPWEMDPATDTNMTPYVMSN